MKLRELRKLAAALPDMEAPDIQEQMRRQVLLMGLDPDALYQELEMTSSYVDTHRDTSLSNTQVQLHSHAFFELIYCCSNCGAEYLVGSERYRIQRGDIIFVPPGISHRPLLPEQMREPYDRYVLWLSVEFMERYAKLFPHAFAGQQPAAGILRTAGTKWEVLADMFHAGVQETEKQKDGWESVVYGNTIVLLTQIKRAAEERSARSMQAEAPELLDRIMAYIEENYAAPITIGLLAKVFFVSSSTISHLFQQKLGVSFYRYVTQRRLIAGKMLIEQGLPLEEVSSRIGYGNYSGFFRAFKLEYGISPREYRSLQDIRGRSLH